MKKLFFSFVSIIMINSIVLAQKRTFMRFYTILGDKFAKGYFAGITDSSIIVYRDTVKLEILISRIGTIKTKRSPGHTILISGLTGAVSLGILGSADGEPKINDGTPLGEFHDAIIFTPTKGFAIYGLAGGIVGIATGAVITLFRKSKIFEINENEENWKQRKNLIEKLPHGK